MDGMWDSKVPSTWKKEFEELKWYDGHANYAKDFSIDEIPEDMEAFICFDGVTYRSEVYLNGEEVGTHEWGYSPFQFRVTDHIKKQNRLFVLVDNFMQEDRVPGVRCDWNNDGGITGGVKIIFVPKIFIENFRTSTRLEGDQAIISVDLFLKSFSSPNAQENISFEIPELNIAHSVSVKAGEKKTIEFSVPKKDIELWNPEKPKLYSTILKTVHETIEDEIGYREIKTEGTQVLLNGKELRLYGVAVHSEFPETGRAATEEGIQLMLSKARELGCNFLRCAHYPYADIFARAMDKAGMLWWEEVPVYWLPNVHLEPQKSLAMGMLREAIVRDWNRAGLIFWSVSNECAGDGTKAGEVSSLKDGNYPYWVDACKMVRDLDPSRLISSADSGHRITSDNGWTPDAGDAFDTDIQGQDWKAGHPDEFYELMDVLGANLYVTNPGDNPIATDKFVEMVKKYNKPLMITEFGSMSSTDDATLGRDKNDLGHPVRHATILSEAYQAMQKHPEIMGYVPWALMDVRVPMHWRWYNRGTGTFAYGMLDNQYQKKHVFDVVKKEITEIRKVFGD
jgi:beta-glucuronidase